MAAKLARFSWLPGGLAAALVVAVGNWVYAPADLPLELDVYDRMMKSVEVTPSREVAIVAIDDASLAQLGEWPWPRDVHASLIDKLKAEGARVVAFTVPFDTARRTSEREKVRAALALLESSNLGNSEQARQLRKLLGESAAGRDPDAHLARAMAAHGNVILPVHIRLNDTATDSDRDSRALLARQRRIGVTTRRQCRSHDVAGAGVSRRSQRHRSHLYTGGRRWRRAHQSRRGSRRRRPGAVAFRGHRRSRPGRFAQ